MNDPARRSGGNISACSSGEISLRGLVLPVGVIKEKVLAAKRAGITTVLLPALNQRDLEDVPPAALEGIRFEFLNSVDEALEHALERDAPRYRENRIEGQPSAG